VTSRIGFSLSGDICLAIQLNECKNVKLSWPAFRINMLMSWAEWLVARHCLIEKYHRFLSLSLNKQKPKFGNLWRKRNGKRFCFLFGSEIIWHTENEDLKFVAPRENYRLQYWLKRRRSAVPSKLSNRGDNYFQK